MSNDQATRSKVLDIAKSFLVQAPAGSGKTSILVQRFLKALANAQTGPEEIVAITFTRKAAAEMRGRILNALQLATQNPPTSAYDLMLWKLAKDVLERDAREGWQLLNNPARLKIQTIDALCAGITKQMPILSRFGAQPQIEQQPQLLYEAAVDQLLQTLDHAPAAANGALFKLLQHLDNDRIKVKHLLTQMLAHRDHWLPTIAVHMNSQHLRQHLEQGLIFACEEALEDLNALVPPVLDVAVMSQEEPQTVSEWLSTIDKLLTVDGAWRKQVTIDQGFAPPSRATNKDEKRRLQECKDAMHAMLDHLRPHEEFRQQLLVLRELPPLSYSDQQWDVVAALLEVLPILAAQLTLMFKDHGKVDFIAVALAALSALQDQDAPSDLSLALDCKIKHILVDEFQDTSHIQFKLLECLTANWDGHDGRTLFLVGDPMQSIYRFRQAEVGLFLKAKQQGIGNVTLEFAQLTVNFRSTANIMQWINRIFTASFPQFDNKTLGAITYMSAHAADQNAQDDKAVEFVTVDDVNEPAAIVKIITQVRQQMPDCSIAILTRAKSHVSKILPALSAAEIPYQAVELETLSKRSLIQDLLAVSKALLHLDDRIAWLAILRAPWCALTLAELQLFAQYESTIFAAIQCKALITGLNVEAQIRVTRVAEAMRDAIALLGHLKFSQVVQRVHCNLGVFGSARHASAGSELTAFFTLLESLDHTFDIYEPTFLLRQLDRLFLEHEYVAPNAVQVMTIHKAKGLEFDVVILPGLSKSTRHQDQQLLLLEQRDYEHEYLLLAPIRAADQKEDAIYKYLAWCERQREEYETLRQLYVAFTRAKAKLYCLADVSDTGTVSGMIKKIWSQVADEFVINEAHAAVTMQRNTTLQRLPNLWFEQADHRFKDPLNLSSV
ncbi:MAG TPA: UvrD-helicase domain-containing protein, partial [Gammaproteobacteria bacterium]|nr:UvrD-helicase domain-containing protein [Gammaproteobacteria bacterium]